MIAPGGKLRLTLDVSSLLEPQWTGLSVFVRRLAAALLASGELDLEFAHRLARLPEGPVLQAMRAGTGAYLADQLSPDESPPLVAIDTATPVLFPGTKAGLHGLVEREASVVHDMTTLFMPETHAEGNIALHLDHFAADLAADEAVFCISEATRSALTTAAPSLASKTRLLPQYVDWPEAFEATERNLPGLGLPPYAVLLGTIEPRKNLELIFRALDRPEIERADVRLVIAGKQGWLVEDLLGNIPLKIRERLVFTGYVSEFVKYRLLRHAEFLIFPSLCEGFGIPALEAMSLGKPVLAARAGSLPEVVAEAGVYFDPLSIDEFASAFAEIASPALREDLAPLALARAAEFTPQRMAAPVIKWVKERA